MTNDLRLVRRAVRLLEDAGFEVAEFGGWAGQLCGLRTRGDHGDVDLLVLDAATEALDEFLTGRQEILAKRLPHKRAFELDGVAIELFLANRTAHGAEIQWWGEVPIALVEFATSQIGGCPWSAPRSLSAFGGIPHLPWGHDGKSVAPAVGRCWRMGARPGRLLPGQVSVGRRPTNRSPSIQSDRTPPAP